MCGDSFFTIGVFTLAFFTVFSSPCVGILFSHTMILNERIEIKMMFSSPCVGILFSHYNSRLMNRMNPMKFSSPCVGILFSHEAHLQAYIRSKPVFVPMCGDSFFTNKECDFNAPYLWMFSSPCVGILFSQQAREAPPAGLSIALLRRGFPID